MNVAAYCRVSTDKTDQLNSMEAQKRFFEEYTRQNGHTLIRLYADEGISGTKIKNRAEFLKMMRDAGSGIFDMVLVKDISRFARNTVDLLNSTRQLKALGIEMLFLTANMSVLGNSEFVLTIFGALAQEESANTSKRVKFGKKLNAEKGRVPNIVYGYDKTPGDYFNLRLNEAEAAVIRRIFDMYVNQGYGAAKISTILNGEGLNTKRNCNWSQNAVSRILTNELYTGKIINGKQEVADFLTGTRRNRDESEWMVVDRPDLRIIAPEVFERAQSILSSRGGAFKIKHERQSSKHLFSTLIKCAGCGYSFRRTEHTYKNTYVRWVCSGRNAKGAKSCSNKTAVDEAELIELLREYFISILAQKKDVVKRAIKEFTRAYRQKDDNAVYEKELKDKLKKNQKNRQRYLDMYADGLMSREEVREKVGTFNSEIEKLENELKLVSCNPGKADRMEEMLARLFGTIKDIVAMEEITNSQLKRVIEKIEVDGDGNCDIYLRLLSDTVHGETFPVSYYQT